MADRIRYDPEQAARYNALEDEFAVMRTLVEILRPLTPRQRGRILRWALDSDPKQVLPPPSTGVPEQVETDGP